ncbi:MAG: hypothetical protein H0V18_08180 [Pyrinomonadaceae bacterium]|jgi:hypothetical protein|nr:hypothetical protein [Pyrinomonadaceae bacterium]
MIEVWEALDCESVGAGELKQIQEVIRQRFGDGSLDSPASIARILADEGAVLRHPEVLSLDTEWRERKLSALISSDELSFSGLAQASASIKKLDTMRRKFEQNSEQQQLRRLREMTLNFKQDALGVARSKTVARQKRLEAKEIAQWLTVWLQSPDIFDDWLSLRQRSPEFIQLTS